MGMEGFMLVKEEKRVGILTAGLHENGSTYRGILELMGRFGYLSFEEAVYGFDLTDREARDRIVYLARQGLIELFDSHTTPQHFYCLTKNGLAALRSHAISDEIHEFNPKTYRSYSQKHDRMLVRIFCALRKMLGPDFLSWLSERTIRQDESLKRVLEAHQEKRILDGLFQINVHKQRFKPDSEGRLVPYEVTDEPWWCGLELELSLKSQARYRKQFEALSECVYDRGQERHLIPLMFFLCGSPTIYESLIKHQRDQLESFGRCLFVFGQAELFLKDPENAPLILAFQGHTREVAGRDINHVRVKLLS
jgi:hypothetical protein